MTAADPPEAYRFDCTLCGECCRGRQIVRLNKEDLLLLAQFLGFNNTGDLFAHGYTEALQEESGWRPIIRFKTRPFRFCPFLINNLTEDNQLQGLCSLHPRFKPLVCHLAPLGRTVDLAEGSETWVVAEPVRGCPGMGRGGIKNWKTETLDLQERLAEEVNFFRFLEEKSPGCKTAAEAVEKLFRWDASTSKP